MYIMRIFLVDLPSHEKKQFSAHPKIENDITSSSCDAKFDIEDVSKCICSFL